MIQVYHIYRALYFNYYYISSISDHQALDPEGWGPLVQGMVPRERTGKRPGVCTILLFLQLVAPNLLWDMVTSEELQKAKDSLQKYAHTLCICIQSQRSVNHICSRLRALGQNLICCLSVFCPLPHILLLSFFPLLPISSVQFSRSVVSNSLRPRELQHARPPCPSPSPGYFHIFN